MHPRDAEKEACNLWIDPSAACAVQATPSAETAMFYFYTNQLKFTPEFMGRVRLVGSVASLIGVGTYNFCLKVGARPFFYECQSCV